MSPASTSDPKPPTEDAELLAEAHRLLAETAPADWAEIDVDYRASSTICQTEVTAKAADGRVLLVSLPAEVHTLFAAHRSRTADELRGAWFSAHLTLRRGREPGVRFNRTDDPGWYPPVDSSVLAKDVEDFPRAPEHIPPWLRTALDEGQAPGGSTAP